MPFKTLILIFLFGCSNLLLGQVDFEPYFNIQWQENHRAENVGAGDFNNDGLTDVVALFNTFKTGSDPDSNTLVFYFQDKKGNLNLSDEKIVISRYASTSIWMKIADINNDSLTDIVITNRKQLTIYYQRIDGGFSSPLIFNFKSYPNYLEIEDMNNDGLTDIILGYRDSLFVLEQNNSGFNRIGHKFTEYSAIGYIAIGDLNADGRKDLAVYGSRRQSVISQLIYYQNSSGEFEGNSSYDTYVDFKRNYNAVAVGDINNDGRDDQLRRVCNPAA
jgi:hypothetical protein